MVILKQVSLRLKSIKNIQKITKTMKMVSASNKALYKPWPQLSVAGLLGCASARILHDRPTTLQLAAAAVMYYNNRFAKIERELVAARPFGYAPRKFYESSHLVKDATTKKVEKDKPVPVTEVAAVKPDAKDSKAEQQRRLYVAVTSDRGLCGGVHSGIARRVRRTLQERNAVAKADKLLCIGDKSRAMLKRLFPGHILVSIKDIGKTSPIFADASQIASAVDNAAFKYDQGEIFYNKYHTPVKYELSIIPFFNKYYIEAAPNMSAFDDVEEDQLESYAEWTVAAMLYYALKESAASEQSARMAAMDNATKNAADMIRKLTLLYNRTRQAVITRELIEIISGAAALK